MNYVGIVQSLYQILCVYSLNSYILVFEDRASLHRCTKIYINVFKLQLLWAINASHFAPKWGFHPLCTKLIRINSVNRFYTESYRKLYNFLYSSIKFMGKVKLKGTNSGKVIR
jgi:hypothetical protein